jgi:hypothetical protein
MAMETISNPFNFRSPAQICLKPHLTARRLHKCLILGLFQSLSV